MLDEREFPLESQKVKQGSEVQESLVRKITRVLEKIKVQIQDTLSYLLPPPSRNKEMLSAFFAEEAFQNPQSFDALYLWIEKLIGTTHSISPKIAEHFDDLRSGILCEPTINPGEITPKISGSELQHVAVKELLFWLLQYRYILQQGILGMGPAAKVGVPVEHLEKVLEAYEYYLEEPLGCWDRKTIRYFWEKHGVLTFFEHLS